MKKLLTSIVVIAASTVAGLLVWRKVESDRQDDLWAEADRLAGELDAREGGAEPTERVSR